MHDLIIINAFEHVCQYLFANKTEYLIQSKVQSSVSTYSWMQKFAHLWNKMKEAKEFNIATLGFTEVTQIVKIVF